MNFMVAQNTLAAEEQEQLKSVKVEKFICEISKNGLIEAAARMRQFTRTRLTPSELISKKRYA